MEIYDNNTPAQLERIINICEENELFINDGFNQIETYKYHIK